MDVLKMLGKIFCKYAILKWVWNHMSLALSKMGRANGSVH